jgi:Flp pilus assembly protein TadD
LATASVPSPVKPRVLLAIAAASFAVAAVLAVVAQGVAGDEEIAHFRFARYAFAHPDNFLNLYGRPFVTLMLCLPAQAGLPGARLASALAAAVTAWAVARIVQRTGLGCPWMAALCVLLQPYFLGHAGAAMTEPWAAGLVALALLGFSERRPLLLAVALALAATARTELALLLLLGALVLVAWRRYRMLLVLPAALVVWHLIGFIQSGDPLYLLHQVSPTPYPAREPLHYVKSFVWIVGLGLFVPIVLGAAVTAGDVAIRGKPSRFLGGLDSTGRATARRALVGSLVVTLFLFGVYSYLAAWRPLTFGNFRYLAFGAAPMAVLAVAGIRVVNERARTAGWIGLAIAAAGAALLWGHPVILGSILLERTTYAALGTAAAWILVYAIPRRNAAAPVVLVAGLGLVSLVWNHRDVLHLRNSPEQEAVIAAASLLGPEASGRPITTAHPLFIHTVGGDSFDPAVWPPLERDFTSAAPVGTLWFWESHYTVKPGSNVDVGSVLAHPEWRYLGGVVSRDTTWAGAYFVKTAPGEPPPSGLVAGPVMEREAWARGARTVESGIGVSRLEAEADPGNPERWLILADRLTQAGRTGEAWTALETAEHLRPGNPDAMAVRAALLLDRGDLDEALDAVTRARAAHPGDALLELLHGEILWRMDRAGEAGPLLRDAADRLPDRWDAQVLAGDVGYREQDWRSAWSRYQAALGIQPGHEDARLRSALCARMLDDMDRAVDQARLLLRYRPGSVRGYLLLGDLLAEMDRGSEAEAVWRSGLGPTGNAPALLERLGASGDGAARP